MTDNLTDNLIPDTSKTQIDLTNLEAEVIKFPKAYWNEDLADAVEFIQLFLQVLSLMMFDL